MDVASELNKDVVTEFPVLKAVGKLDPGVYLVTARPWKEKTSDSERAGRRAARDAMDGGLRPRPHRDLGRRRRSCAGAVARAPPARSPGVELKLVARNNEVLADEDDRRRRAGRLRSGPLARQGRLGAGASGRDARRRLQLPQPGAERLRSHRPRRRRPRRARRPRRLPLHRARRLSLGRDGVRDRAPARRQGRRPDRPAADPRRQAPRRRRVQARDASPTRASAGAPSPSRCCRARPRANGAIRGLRRPEGRSDRRGRVPARGLHPRAARLHAEARQGLSSRPASRSRSRSTRASSTARRRAASTSPARSACRRSKAGRSPGFPGYVAGLADDDFTTVETQFTDKVTTDAKGHAELSVDLPDAASTRPLEAKLIVDVGEPGGRTVERTVTLPVRAKGVAVGVKKDFDSSLSAPATWRPSRRSRSRPTGRASRARAPNGRSIR